MLLLLLPFFLHWCDPLLGELPLIYLLFQLYMLHLQSIFYIHRNTSTRHFLLLYMLLLLLPFFLDWCGCSGLFLEFSFQSRHKDYMYILLFLQSYTLLVLFFLSKHDSISYALHKPLHQSDHM